MIKRIFRIIINMNSVKRIEKISSLTLAAGDTFFSNNQENKFFFNSLINSKKLFFEDSGIFENYFLISNETIFKESKIPKIIFNKEIINYGSLGSLIFFLNNISTIPDRLIINYLDKKISDLDFHNLLSDEINQNIISANLVNKESKFENESFYYKDNNYIFNGFVILDKKVLKKILNLDQDYFYLNIPYLFNSNILNDTNLKIIKNNDLIQEVRNKNDIAQILLGSKSKSLRNLRNIKTAKIPKFITIDEDNLKNLRRELKEFSNQIIIRSDSDAEDSFHKSSAGKFLSIGPIDNNNFNKVVHSIKSVLKSYTSTTSIKRVIIQDYVKDIKTSGVITTRLIQNGAPYFCISFSEGSSSDNVTSGRSNELKNVYIHKNVNKLDKKYKKYQKLLNLIKELIEITNYELLDIEFATSKNNQINLLQVRPLLLKNQLKDNKKNLVKNIRKFQQLQNRHQNIYGSKTILSNMSDWNPAEMLGESPNYLSLSLYKTFITNDSWHRQRKEFGYRGEVDQQLMFNFGNKCFIDIRGSLNSFLTKSLNSKECELIIDSQIDKLKNNPEFHDKIEFEIAETSYIFDLENKLIKNYKQILPESSINLWLDDLKSIEKNYEKILNINNRKINSYYKRLNSNMDFLDKQTINAVKKNMSIPFAHHARLAFIYFSHLNNFVQNEVITLEEKQNLLNNLQTISSQFSRHLLDVKNKKMSYKKFVHIYGHTRPNSYDLNSSNINQKGRDFIDFLIDNVKNYEQDTIDITKPLKKIDDYLIKNNYRIESKKWHDLFKNTISSRESSKFMYSKAIDLTLNQLNKEETFDNSRLIDLDFETFIETGKISYVENYTNLELPDVMINSNDFLFFENLNTKPNFVGNTLSKGDIILGSENNMNQLKNKIVLLPNADPGWDWVFSIPIKGLITKYGGPNSHMAIRAAEKNIVSVFGVGDDLFNQIQQTKTLEIDPKNKKLYFNL